jgi:hypothetical protein
MATKAANNAARELRDDALHETCLFLHGQNQRQQAWVETMIKNSAAKPLSCRAVRKPSADLPRCDKIW